MQHVAFFCRDAQLGRLQEKRKIAEDLHPDNIQKKTNGKSRRKLSNGAQGEDGQIGDRDERAGENSQ